MWKLLSGAHRSTLGSFRLSVREDYQAGTSPRVFSALSQISVEGCRPLTSLAVAPAAPSSTQDFDLFKVPRPASSLRPPLVNTRFNTGQDDCEWSWKVTEAFHLSTALLLSYTLLHKRNRGLETHCPVLAVKIAKSAHAQPITQRPPSPQSSNQNLSSISTTADSVAACCLKDDGPEPTSTFSNSHVKIGGEEKRRSIFYLQDDSEEGEAGSLGLRGREGKIDPLFSRAESHRHAQEEIVQKVQSLEDAPNLKQSLEEEFKPKQSLEEEFRPKQSLEEEFKPKQRLGAQFSLELRTLEGINLLEAGNPLGIIELKKQVKRGSSVAAFYLGMSYEQGHLVGRSLRLARHYYQLGSAGGNPEAQFNLAVFHLQGLGGLQQDENRAKQLLALAAAGGSPQAQQALGTSVETQEQLSERERRDGRDLYWLAQSFESLGETSTALEFYQRALAAGYSRAARATRRLHSFSQTDGSTD